MKSFFITSGLVLFFLLRPTTAIADGSFLNTRIGVKVIHLQKVSYELWEMSCPIYGSEIPNQECHVARVLFANGAESTRNLIHDLQNGDLRIEGNAYKTKQFSFKIINDEFNMKCNVKRNFSDQLTLLSCLDEKNKKTYSLLKAGIPLYRLNSEKDYEVRTQFNTKGVGEARFWIENNFYDRAKWSYARFSCKEANKCSFEEISFGTEYNDKPSEALGSIDAGDVYYHIETESKRKLRGFMLKNEVLFDLSYDSFSTTYRFKLLNGRRLRICSFNIKAPFPSESFKCTCPPLWANDKESEFKSVSKAPKLQSPPHFLFEKLIKTDAAANVGEDL